MSRRAGLTSVRRQRCAALAQRPEGVSVAELAAAVGLSKTGAAYLMRSTAADHGMCVLSVPCHRGWTKRYFVGVDAAERWLGRPVAAQTVTAPEPRQTPKASPPAPAACADRADEAEGADYFVPPKATGRAALHDVPTVPGWGRPPVRRAGAEDHRRYPHSFGGATR